MLAFADIRQVLLMKYFPHSVCCTLPGSNFFLPNLQGWKKLKHILPQNVTHFLSNYPKNWTRIDSWIKTKKMFCWWYTFRLGFVSQSFRVWIMYIINLILYIFNKDNIHPYIIKNPHYDWDIEQQSVTAR